MAALRLVVLALALLRAEVGSGAGSGIWTSVDDIGSKTRLTCTLNHSTTEITGHRWVKGGKVLKEDALPDMKTEYEAAGHTGSLMQASGHGGGTGSTCCPRTSSSLLTSPGSGSCRVDLDERSGEYSCIFLPELAGTTRIEVKGLPNIKAVKRSEHATERETVVLGCKSDSFPPVSEWVWYKMESSGDQVISNTSHSKYLVISLETKTELHISNLDLETDPGKYACNGTNSEGTSQAVIVLRVRNRFAALWPFLGIVAEVLVLVTVIFIYEKRRKPDEVLDDEDTGSAPLKSSGHVNDKGKNVRQRNAN
ncbi:basigin isoform X1 [Mirounga angustirostris]|uniref:basigin isoform X2 n=1 Tax=Mirounga leonina TaxID=9715 RepID=UPI00156BE1A2|nr:basigin isoform X2 [Mirounga leonina]XP_045719478.1 basigin isoform X1 [Mirounga angustirostris]